MKLKVEECMIVEQLEANICNCGPESITNGLE